MSRIFQCKFVQFKRIAFGKFYDESARILGGTTIHISDLYLIILVVGERKKGYSTIIG
ncbi:MAG: hypothetical protein JKX91_07845 [Rhizobiaceae bacterium]|nr:hypothetical protein [Rhizobiaceae bacterium]